MPIGLKRRAPVDEEPESEQEAQSDGYEEVEGDTQASGPIEQLARKLVRYALSCEYSRQPIRRTDITSKVLGAHSKHFKIIFAEAQMMLQMAFGMMLVELPKQEKVTLQQRRAAQKAGQTANSSSNAYILTSTLPAKYRIPSIITPPKIPTAEDESIYVGLYTFIIATIYLGGGSLSEAKLDRYLKRTNADQSTPIDRTDKLLQRMIKDGYISKIKDSSSGEEMIEYIVGPRGKTEVGEESVVQLVKTVYGGSDVEDLDKRLERSLGLAQRPEEPKVKTNGLAKDRKRKLRRPNEDDEEEDEEDEDE